MRAKNIFLLFLLLLPSMLRAYFFGGYFTYSKSNGNAYEFELTTFSDTASSESSCRAVVEIWSNSGTVLVRRDTLTRDNGQFGACDSMIRKGEDIGLGIMRNTYHLQTEILNYGNFQLRFASGEYSPLITNLDSHQTMIITLPFFHSPFLQLDNSPEIMHDTPLLGCQGTNSIFDDGWIDIDSDSIVFLLDEPASVLGFQDMNDYSDTFKIGRFNGIVEIVNPFQTGWFVFAVKYDSFRDQNLIGSASAIRPIFIADTCHMARDESEEIWHWQLYPNPTKSDFSLHLPENIKSCTLKIHDITGREVAASRTYRAGDPPVDVTHLSAGLYFVEVRVKDRVEVIKLVKQ